MEDEQNWKACEECEGNGQIENMIYDSDHDCSFGYDCECTDAVPYFICNKCGGDGWFEVLDD